jgi:hypothetical protein
MNKFFREKVQTPFQRTLADVPWFGPTLSAVLVATLINVLTDTLSTWGGPSFGWAFIVVLVILTFLVVYLYNRRYAYWRRNLGPIAEIAPPHKHEGLIFLFTQKETAREAIRHHLPVLKHVWLIVTPEKQAEAGEIVIDFPELSFSILPISNLYDTQSCYNVVRHIYERGTQDVKISPKNTIADITGGTKPMTMGMIVACIEGGFPIEHVPTKYDPANKPLGPLPPIEIRLQKS